MKKCFLIPVIAMVVTASVTRVSAQVTDTVTTLPPITVTTSTQVNQRVSTAFEKYFKNALEPRWYKLNKNYIVQFIQDDMKRNAQFTKKGGLIYTVSYGTAVNLPDAIRTSIKQSYPDFTISKAINVKESARDIWVVNLESLNRYVMVRVEEGEMEEVGNYQKSS